MAEQSIKVLLVEDNPGDVHLLRELLWDVTGEQFQLIPVERLEEALKSTETERFDVMLLDLSLPDSHGLETFITAHRQTMKL
jgi:DNA-binding response OmpR family regulator